MGEGRLLCGPWEWMVPSLSEKQNSKSYLLESEGAAVGFLLLCCRQSSVCNTEGLLSLLRGNESPPLPLLYLSQPLAPGFILEMLLEGLWFSCFFSGRFTLWESFFFFFLQTRLPLSFPRVCRVFVLITFLVMFWRDWKCDFPDSQRQGVTWPAFPHRSPCGECVYSRPGDDGKNTPLVHSLPVKT